MSAAGEARFYGRLLDEFPSLTVTTIDRNKRRADDLQAMHLGGVDRLTAFQMDATELAFEDNRFDVVAMLEVLEHIPAAAKAVVQAVRVARRFVVLTVPSKPDDNPRAHPLVQRGQVDAAFFRCGSGAAEFRLRAEPHRADCQYVA